jgi:hypothetical protein
MLSGGDGVQRKTGQTILESDFGKGLLKDIETQATNKVDNKAIAKNIGTNLATAVMQGVITTDQAKSISMALGEKLGNYAIPADISATIVSLLGPNGENLASDPLTIALNIQEQSMNNLSGTFAAAMENSVTTTYATNMAQLVGGAVVTGIGAVITGAGVATAWAGGAGLLGIAGGAATMTAGTGIMLDAKKEQEALEMSEELKSASVQLGVQELAQNQGLIDSLNRQYDIKLKTAKTSEEIATIEKNRSDAIDAVAANNKKALDYLVSQKDLLGEDAFNTAIKAEVEARYKDAGAMKAFADQAIKDLEGLDDSSFKTQIGLEFASDNLDPMTVSRLVKLAESNDKISTEFNTLVSVTGSSAEAGTIIALLTKADASDTTIPVIVEFLNEDKKNIKGNTKALAWLSDMKTKYGITIDVNKDGINKIKSVRSLMNKLDGENTKPITKDIIVQELKENPGDPGLTQILSQWDAITAGKSSVTKQVLIDFVAAGDQNVVDAYMSATGKSIPSFLSPESYTAAKNALLPEAQAWLVSGQGKDLNPYAPPEVDPNDTKDSKARDTTLDDLLKRLKLTRDASINAEGGINELRKAFKKATGDIKIFNGVNQQLRKLYGADSGFIDFIGGMDNATEKGYVNAAKLKKGIVELTGDGVKAMQLYKEAQLGAFGDAANEAILQAQKQRTGFLSLKSAGADSADALEMVADANFMVSLSAAKTQKEVKTLIDLFRLQRKEEEITKATTNPLEYFNDQKNVMEERFSLDERNIRAEYEPQIKLQQDLIDNEQDLIREKQYEMELNEKINTERIDQLNSEIDAMQHSMQIGIDKQLSDLSDESARYSEDMSIMNHTIEGINKKYDEQEKALSRVSQINQDIIDKQKSQISLADALTSGDISAAAQAEAAMREQAAKSMATTASDNLSRAREAAVNGVTSASGMTMDQIQERQYQIDRTTYGLTVQKQRIEDQIAAKQKELYDINIERQKITDEIKVHERAIYELTNNPDTGLIRLQDDMNMYLGDIAWLRGEWENSQLAIDNATANTELFRAKVEKAEALVNDINTYWNGIEDEKNLTVTIKKIEQIVREYAPEKTPAQIKAEKIAQYRHNFVEKSRGKSDAEIAKILGLAKGGVVPKYFSVGGAARGTDIIPAMLTPGEFVVNAKSAQAAGPLLAAINSPSFNGFKAPQMSGVSSNSAAAVGSSMYNYSIGINVNQSNASPDDIAKTVMTQIKYIDSQRIRGQR